MKIGVVGTGTVGSALIDMFIKTEVSVAVICSSKKICRTPTKNWRNELIDGDGLVAMKTEVDVIIDCTANEDIASQYLTWNKHVIAANKKAFSGELKYFKELVNSDKKVYFESSCGAGLPLLRTLSDMVKSGDEIQLIEGVLSGTLSYIFNNFTGKFSDIVNKAKELGFTEPDPRDDLNGIDVMRKVLILARICKFDLEASQVQVENIVPEALRNVNVDDFMRKLPEFDSYFSEIAKSAAIANKKLRYVGSIDFKTKKATVSLNAYEESHVLAQLKGSDNLIKITTKRFPNGLVIQGSGAGAEVTAFGCYSDYLRLVGQ